MVNDAHTQRPRRVHQISRTIAVKKGCGLKEKVKLHALTRSRKPPAPPRPPPSDEVESEEAVVARAPPPPPLFDEKRVEEVVTTTLACRAKASPRRPCMPVHAYIAEHRSSQLKLRILQVRKRVPQPIQWPHLRRSRK